MPVKSKLKILQNFVAFSEYMNFIWSYYREIYVVPVKIKVEISQNFVALSEYMNFTA